MMLIIASRWCPGQHQLYAWHKEVRIFHSGDPRHWCVYDIDWQMHKRLARSRYWPCDRGSCRRKPFVSPRSFNHLIENIVIISIELKSAPSVVSFQFVFRYRTVLSLLWWWIMGIRRKVMERPTMQGVGEHKKVHRNKRWSRLWSEELGASKTGSRCVPGAKGGVVGIEKHLHHTNERRGTFLRLSRSC